MSIYGLRGKFRITYRHNRRWWTAIHPSGYTIGRFRTWRAAMNEVDSQIQRLRRIQ